MKYGFVIPGGDPDILIDLAAEAEFHGWDGVFLPDAIGIETATVPPCPWFDPWLVLAAMARNTRRIWLGPMVTAVPRRRPWKLARETVTLDHLSGGRLILAVGLGAAADDGGFYKVGEPMDLKTRAALLDEGLDIVTGLWSGLPFTFHGKHHHVDAMTMLPTPVQKPRIPVWVVAAWPRPKSVERALRWDGVLPQKVPLTPADVQEARTMAPGDRPFDIVVDGETPGDDLDAAAAMVRPFAEAGATWWLETRWTQSPTTLDQPGGLDAVRARIWQGPPRASVPLA